MTSSGKKFDEHKNPLSLIPPKALWDLGEIYAYGAKKYGAGNWAKGMLWSRIYSATMRHLLRWWNGENLDSESNRHHLLHAAWCCITLYMYGFLCPELEDRPQEQPAI